MQIDEDVMTEAASAGESPDSRSAGARLDSWKAIAAYLKRDVTTVQRWERREGMPVHRHLHDKSSSVYAFRDDLDAWTRGRSGRAASRDVSMPLMDDGARSTEVLHAPAQLVSTGSARRWRRARRGAAAAAVLGLTAWAVGRSTSSWSSPLVGAQVQLVDFDGTERTAAISRDGRLLAFLSDRDGRTDVWVTQIGTGQFHNLTRGSVGGLVNPSVRTISFTPDGTAVTFWNRTAGGDPKDISTWSVPVWGGLPRPYLEGVAEFDWSSDGSRLVYHTAGPGDPTFVRDRGQPAPGRPLIAAPVGLHAHFPSWSRDDAFIYFVQGAVPDGMDIWRIGPTGGHPERLTNHHSRVSYPVVVDRQTLLYLATAADGSGPWLWALDIGRKVVHRVSAGVDRYTSLSASADGRRLVATLAGEKESLWRLPLSGPSPDVSALQRISLTTGRGVSPRLGPRYLLYVSSADGGDAIWKLDAAGAAQLWTAPDARLIGSPAPTRDGRLVAFSARQQGRTMLYVMNQDGRNARVVTTSLDLRSGPAWAPDARSLAVSANEDGAPRLFSVALDGGAVVTLVREYAADPVWSPDGRFILYSGPDIGTTFRLEAVAPTGTPYPLAQLTLTRGARALRFLPGGRTLVTMRGDMEHKDLWLVDLDTGTERQLTKLPADFHLHDFDVAPDGRELVLDRIQEQSAIVLFDRPRQ